MIENLYRSPTDKWIGGVAEGLAKRFGLPSVVVRILLLFRSIFLHVILPIVYLVLWVVLPEGPSEYKIAYEY